MSRSVPGAAMSYKLFDHRPQGSALRMNSPRDEDDDYSTFEVEHSSIQVHWS